jgi:alkanesulfonate monooxygenase SsuD/methylene tetrahydromethanopterin reductase-like flavin-dependent oxidoreductase (luciferase family)
MDYGRALEFGISVQPTVEELEENRALVRTADAAGVDLVGIQDHPYQPKFLETMALITSLLGETRRVRIFPDVANLPLRPPAMLAKQAVTLDVLSGGRFELGIGAGGYWDAIEAMGGPRRSPGESVESLAEAITIIRQALGEAGSVRFTGKHYRVQGYRPGPHPVHPMEIWVGAYKPRMLRLIGRLADGWLPSLGRMGLEELAASQLVVDESARKAGREPLSIRRLLNVSGSFGSVEAAGGITGSVEQWVELLSGWVTDLGFDTFVLWPSVPTVDQVEIWGGQVAPLVREEVVRRRSAAGLG